jgi:hypothetical protein
MANDRSWHIPAVATAAKDGRSRLESGRWRSAARCLPERGRASPSLSQEIERLQRSEEATVVATGAPRERGCPPWVVLSVKAVEALGALHGEGWPPWPNRLGGNRMKNATLWRANEGAQNQSEDCAGAVADGCGARTGGGDGAGGRDFATALHSCAQGASGPAAVLVESCSA